MIVTDLAVFDGGDYDSLSVITYDDDNTDARDILSSFRATAGNDDDGVSIYIHSLITNPDHLRKGYAERNLRLLFERVKEMYKGKHILAYLHTSSCNIPATSLYSKVGMKADCENGVQIWSIKLQ